MKTLLSLILLLPLSAAEKPNIVLFVSDDHGLDALGCYGNPVIETPNMDKLAAEGVRFTNAYCTSASCAASRSVILTGLYGHATGSYGHVHDYHHFSTYSHVKSLPVRLSAAGYHTARIGKYHVAPESVYQFDTTHEANPRSTVEMAEACRPTIAGDQPFFLYFCPDDPHRGAPFTPDDWTDPNTFGNRPEGYPGVEAKKYDPTKVIVPTFLPDSKECREELAEYYQSVSRIDQGLGKLFSILEETGKADNTVVIYLSDNGIAFPGAKTTVYEPGIKLPLIITDPRKPDLKGKVNEAFVSWVDLTPTILELSQIDESKEQFQGRSLLPILATPNPKGWNEVYAAHNFHELTMYYPMRVIRIDDFKLIWNIAHGLDYPFATDLWAASTWQAVYHSEEQQYGKRSVKDYLKRPQFELYNLATDPDEVNNLAEDPAHSKQLASLKEKLKAFQLKTKDPWQISWGDYETEVQGTGVGL
ncbi:MAG: sulfatase family protein [Roseibacillus sp.]